MSMKKVQNESMILSVFMVMLFLFSKCEPRGSNRETIENDNSYEMMEGEDVPPAENDTTLDSADISHMRKLQKENQELEDILDSIYKNNPNLSYTYVPAEEGQIRTILGDYKVDVDNTMTHEEENTIGVLLQKRFENRQKMLKYYNKLQNVDMPASPKEGYAAFYHELRQKINYPEEAKKLDTEGLLFVQLAIESDGTVSNVKISENINTDDDELEEKIEKAAIKAIKETNGEWKSARKDGEPVRSKLEIPVWFDPDTTRS